jgi:hypothetical protein
MPRNWYLYEEDKGHSVCWEQEPGWAFVVTFFLHKGQWHCLLTECKLYFTVDWARQI